jgi:hypothetical protein
MSDQLLMSPQSSTAVFDAEEDAIDGPMVKVKSHHDPVPHIHDGYGACSASGCNCQAYSGSAYTCANCGHNYATHW